MRPRWPLSSHQQPASRADPCRHAGLHRRGRCGGGAPSLLALVVVNRVGVLAVCLAAGLEAGEPVLGGGAAGCSPRVHAVWHRPMLCQLDWDRLTSCAWGGAVCQPICCAIGLPGPRAPPHTTAPACGASPSSCWPLCWCPGSPCPPAAWRGGSPAAQTQGAWARGIVVLGAAALGDPDLAPSTSLHSNSDAPSSPGPEHTHTHGVPLPLPTCTSWRYR